MTNTLDLRCGIIDINNAKLLIRDKEKINVCNITSEKMMGLCLPEIKKKEIERNRAIFN